uniref:malate:quinone oxidoreductase n=1 Tax=uncultured Pluralibacter sp. TaxID=1490864 RepID=UPI002635D397
ATFSTRFLKNGSLWDLMASTNASNIMPMLNVGLDNFDLVKYLVGQVLQTDKERLAALREYYPQAKKEDWRLWQAGQRVQIIKRDPIKGGVLRLGTEVVSDDEGTVAALLGASPGASTAAPIMLQLLEQVFSEKVRSPAWQEKLRAVVPDYGLEVRDPLSAARSLAWTSEVLELHYESRVQADPVPSVDRSAPVAVPDREIADIAL